MFPDMLNPFRFVFLFPEDLEILFGSSDNNTDSTDTVTKEKEKEELVTSTVDLKDWKVTQGEYNILYLNKVGKLVEMVIVSDDSNYSLKIETDTFELKRTYDELSELSDYVDSINAYQDGYNYILSMYDIKFTKINIHLLPNTSMVFNRIYIKYDHVK